MSYPLIILGAGASHDYMDRRMYYREDRFIPPLSNELFQDRFSSFINDFPEVADLAAHASGVGNFEQYLTNVQEVLAKTNKERYKQLIALRFYLSRMFWWVSENYYHKINYYRSLITTIKDKEPDARACFVNFNYDLLLEKNISEIDVTRVDSYIESNIKVIKIHGACNWFYMIDPGFSFHVTGYQHFLTHADNFASNFVNSTRGDKVLQGMPMSIDWDYNKNFQERNLYFLPAIAIPVATKLNYVCPNPHMAHLDSAVATTERILILGWKGNDEFLIKKLTQEIHRKVYVTIVSKTSSEDIKRKLSINTFLEINALPLTFTEFMHSEHLDRFFL